MNAEASGFDPSTFLSANLTEPNTRRPPIPAGTNLIGTLGSVPTEPRKVLGKEDQTKVYYFLEIPVELDLTTNPAVHQLVGQDKVTSRYSLSLDFTSSGTLDMSKGKNNSLRMLRDALNLNNPGDVFNFGMVPGRQVLCRIKNRSDKDSGEVFDEVGSIARPS